MTFSDPQPKVQGHDIIQRDITRKRYKLSYSYNGRLVVSRVLSIEWRHVCLNELEQPVTQFSKSCH